MQEPRALVILRLQLMIRRLADALFGSPMPTYVRVRASKAASRVTGVGRRFRHDRRGGAAVQMMVLMPVVLFAFVAGVKLWEIMMVRRSLHTGTYLATRYLSLYPPATTNEYEWSLIAGRFVRAELLNNPWVDETKVNDTMTPVYVTLLDANNDCTDRFDVRAEYTFLGPAGQRGELGLPQLAPFTLVEERRGEVLCD